MSPRAAARYFADRLPRRAICLAVRSHSRRAQGPADNCPTDSLQQAPLRRSIEIVSWPESKTEIKRLKKGSWPTSTICFSAGKSWS